MADNIFHYYFDHPAKQVNDFVKEQVKRGDQGILNNGFFQDPNITGTNSGASLGGVSAAPSSTPSSFSSDGSASDVPLTTPPTEDSLTPTFPVENQIILGLEARLESDGTVKIQEGAVQFSDGTIFYCVPAGVQGTLDNLRARRDNAALTDDDRVWDTYNLYTVGYTSGTNYKIDVSVNKQGLNSGPGTEGGENLWLHTVFIPKDALAIYPGMLIDRRDRYAKNMDIYTHERLGAFKIDAIPPADRGSLPTTPEELLAYDILNGTSWYAIADKEYQEDRIAHRELFNRKLEEYRNEFVRLSFEGDGDLGSGIAPGLAFGRGISAQKINPSTFGPGTYPTLKLSMDLTAKENPTDPDLTGVVSGTWPGTTANTLTIDLPDHLAGKKVAMVLTANTTGRAVSITFNGANVTLTASKEYTLSTSTANHNHSYDNNGTPATTADTTTNNYALAETPITGACTVDWTVLN